MARGASSLRNLMTAYFNQDWPDDHADWADVVTQFRRTSRPEEVAEARAELEALQQIKDDTELEHRFSDLGGYFSPGLSGISLRQWLRATASML